MADPLDDSGAPAAAGRSPAPTPGAPACGSGSVRRPRISSQASNGRELAAEIGVEPRRGCRPISAVEPATTPATTSLWPPRYFEAEWTTRSTPSDSGRWKTGVAQLLSMIAEDAVRAGRGRPAPRRRCASIASWSGFPDRAAGARQGRRDRRLVAAVDIGRPRCRMRLQQRAEEAEGVGVDVAHRDDAVAGRDEARARPTRSPPCRSQSRARPRRLRARRASPRTSAPSG